MREHGRNDQQIGKQFRLAFAEVNGMAKGEFTKHAEYHNFRVLVDHFAEISANGREWYDAHRAKKMGFYRMAKLARLKLKKPAWSEPTPAPEPEPEEEETPKPDVYISKICRQVAREGKKVLESTFFAKLATLVDSVEQGEIESPEKYADVLVMLKRLVAVGSEALEKLER